MNKLIFALPMLLVVFLSGCVGQPSPTYTTTTTTTTPTTTPTISTTTTTQTATTTSTTAQGSLKQFTVHEGSSAGYSTTYYLTPSTITVNKGDTVQITVIDDGGTHNLYIDGYNVRSQTISSGQSSVQFVADKAGTFGMWCEVDSHKALGIVGQVVVQ